MSTLRAILHLFYLAFKPAIIPLLLITCLFQAYRISELQKNVITCRHSEDDMADRLSDKKTQLQDALDANYLLGEKIKYTEGQNDYMLDRCQALYKQLRITTDVLESIARCAHFRLEPSKCGVEEKELGTLMYQNRKANF